MAQKKVRKTRHGLAIPATTTTVDPENTTPYGGMRLKTGAGFAGPKGTAITAGVLDIDGTLQDWGAGASKKVLDWMETVEKRHPDMVWLVITARTHDYDYRRSFNWLVKHVPYEFIGPFCRADDDPRYASEFKRELAQGFEDMGLYKIVAAADDNRYVIDMWKHWAETHFEDTAEFDLLETSYTSYPTWRSELPGTEGYRMTTWAPTVHRPAGVSRYGDDPEGWGAFDAWEGRNDDVQGALAAMEVENPSVSRAQKRDARLDLEDEVYAEFSELTMHDIQGMDTEVLQQMLGGPPTAPLDVREIFDELGENPFTPEVA
jgi:hypothetical protein